MPNLEPNYNNDDVGRNDIPEEYLHLNSDEYDSTTPRQRAVAFLEMNEGKKEIARERICILQPLSDWGLRRSQFYWLAGSSGCLNLGVAYMLTTMLPSWLQSLVVVPISLFISFAIEKFVGLMLAKLVINRNLVRRVKSLRTKWKNPLGMSLGSSFADFQIDHEQQEILFLEYLALLVPLGEVFAIATIVQFFQQQSDHEVGQFLNTVLLVSPIGVLPLIIAMLFSHYVYQPHLRWIILRSYKLYLGGDDPGIPPGGEQTQASSSSSGKKVSPKKDEDADDEERRTHLPFINRRD